MINIHTKFYVSSLSHSRDILRGLKFKNGSRDVTTPISGTVCHLWAGTGYILKCLRLPATKKWKATPNVNILVLTHPIGS